MKRHRLTAAIGLCAIAAFGIETGAPSVDAAPGLRFEAMVERVVDGDTIEVVIDGDDTITSIRIAGLQTRELHKDDPRQAECLAAEAAVRLTELLDGERVQLRARNVDSTSLGRPLRHVFLDGRNIAEPMLREGHGLPLEFGEEPDYSARNTSQALLAARDGVGIWDPTACGVGPSQGAVIDMVTNYDAAGVDDDNVNGEYVMLRNRGTQSLDLDGWILSDSSSRRFDLPSGYRLDPGDRLLIRMGRGTNTSDSVYLNEDKPVMGNENDGMFLYDPDFDIRAWDMWPCSQACGTPPPLVISKVNFDAPGNDQENPNGEFIVIRNTGDQTVDFQDWLVEVPPLHLTSVRSRPLAPGATLTVFVGRGTNTDSTMYLNQDGPVLNNARHLVMLHSPGRVLVSCDARGGLECPLIVGPLTDIGNAARATATAVRITQ